MALQRLRKDDTVMVIAGKERGKTGKVLRVLADRERVLIERVNMVKRHVKPRGVQQPGGIQEKEASIHLSNVVPIGPKCKKAIANFKLREGMPIGAMVTLRGDRMYEFFDRLVNVTLPRVRDFKGVPDRAFDGRGNYSLGLREQVIFPEINLDKVDKIKGLTVVVCTSARTDAEAKTLLRALGMPFRA